MTGDGAEPPQRGGGLYARLVNRLRWVVVVLWVAGAVGATIWLPALPTTNGNYDVMALLPAHSPAVAAEVKLLSDFSFPLESNTVVVLRNPRGLPPLTQLDVLFYALSFDKDAAQLHAPLPDDRVLAALPLFNTAHLFPGAHESGTAAATYLFFSPGTSLASQARLAQQYARHFGPDSGAQVRVTGSAPARQRQSLVVLDHLLPVEILTLVFTSLVVAVTFRSVVAPLLTLSAALLSYLVAVRLLGLLVKGGHVALPPPLEPLVVALVLGILTDYSVFFLTEARDRMRGGEEPRAAVAASLRHNIPIIFTAGLTVAAGTAALTSAHLQLYRAFGPGLALAVGVGALSAVTFVPAVLCILRPRTYWPSRPYQRGEAVEPTTAPARFAARVMSTRTGAAVGVVLCVGGLVVAALPVRHAQLDTSFIRSLAGDTPERQGAHMVDEAFTPGLLGPTVVLVSAPGIAQQQRSLGRLQQVISAQRGVASVIGPASLPFLERYDVFTTHDGGEVRIEVFFDSDPLGGPGIATLRRLEQRMPEMLSQAGLANAHAVFAGNSSIARGAADATARNLALVLVVAFAAEYVLLAVFLGALLAPLLLLLASGLVVAAALGLTTWVFQDHLHTLGLTFYVPFATAVLLVALGSDYNVFGVGRLWQLARRRALRPAIRLAMPETAKAITAAGFTLAGSFAILAVVPLEEFREMAFTLVVGLLIDTFVVRSLLTPALLTLAGPASSWPGGRLRRHRAGRGGTQ